MKGIELIKNCKAPGEDGIVIKMIKAAKIEIVPPLQSLFNKILESGNYPDNLFFVMYGPNKESEILIYL